MFELLQPLLTFVAAIIPVLALILTFLRGRTEKTTEQIDSPSLKVLTIIRHPVDEKIRKRVRRRYITFYFIGAVFYVLYLITVFYLIFTLTNLPLIITLLLLLIPFSIILLSFSSSYLISSKNALEARYFLFKSVDILIDADYHYLFNKCHEVLRAMEWHILEVNERTATLEAQKYIGSVGWKIINVKIEPAGFAIHDAHKYADGSIMIGESSVGVYSIKLNFEGQQGRDYEVLQSDSFYANLFINRLISKKKSTDEKTKE